MKLHITDKITINPLVFLLAVGLAFFGRTNTLVAFAPAMLIHECGHIFAAKASGLRLAQFDLLPFGANVKVEGLYSAGAAREVLCAFMGPCANLVFAAAVISLKHNMQNPYLDALLFSNLSIAAMNMLPCLPLDGGHIVKSLLTLRFSPKASSTALSIIGIVFGFMIILFGVYCVMINSVNLTFFVFGGFLVISAAGELKEAKFNILHSFVKTRHTDLMGVNAIAVRRGTDLIRVIKRFDANKYNIVYVLGDNQECIATLNENDIMRTALKFGVEVKLESQTLSRLG